MDTSTGACPTCASDESRSSLVLGPHASATPRPSPCYTTVTDGTPLPNLEQPTMNPNNSVILIQNNYIAEGGTINIFSSHCTGSTVTKLEHVAPTAESALFEPPLVRQSEPVEPRRERVVLSGNSFGECVMINVGSPNCTKAVKQTALASRKHLAGGRV
ncbi:uncharacterized protein EDB91DRAFT_1143304 [Suillus paluster]|uniref:uncharacterized protein n=1 Tax=Suillus paluster TaxID=48578 RepID=UPI001B87586B|nr:uncharacterized protein EDB91DRAFT_1143304 [Suillus paluster]KAG1735872.1 hypothetical protein EDB91DRAFT_1143304 [Suillus paluster]